MGKIKQLSPHEAQKIAAGQVVDRPANIIKELVENSLDAGATLIAISIDDAGKASLRIVDNGCGMDREDAQLSFAKHATSKIKSIDELPTISTFGFRGEALASIASVSKVTMLTKEASSAEGIRLTISEGVISLLPTACPDGTDILIESLFYNVPARAKFLKSSDTELRHCMQTIYALCFAHPHIHFKILVNGKQTLNCPPQTTILGRCAQLWENTNTKHLMAISATDPKQKITLSGAISNHEWFRFDRNAIFFLVNNRWVTNQHLIRALTKGFNNVIPQGRYPLACVSITCNPADIDINMHPRKEEIKFSHPRIVEQLIQNTVRGALEKNISHQVGKPVIIANNDNFVPYTNPAPSFIPAQNASAIRWNDLMFSADEIDMPRPNYQAPSMPIIPTAPIEQPIQTQLPVVETLPSDITLIGQYRATYLLIEQSDGLFLIDQHAAHERILYEQFANRFEKVATVNLLFPQMIPCSQQDLELLEPHLQLFHDQGIVIERFGKDQLVIQATPVPLQHVSMNDLIMQAISWIKETEHIDREQFMKTLHEKLRAQMACKAAVKAGDVLTHTQMIELLEKLHQTPNRFSCPHGRPTGWLLSIDEIEKKFRRKL